ncbi:MAG: GxxExxY protein [Pirellulales bacterium]|nr:GxxExxY protein [Pirellulales bacterium]
MAASPGASRSSTYEPIRFRSIHTLLLAIQALNSARDEVGEKCGLAVYYKVRLLGTRYRPDLTVYNAIVVELKAITDLNSDHEAQLFNYMRIARQQVGYLLNFGKKGQLQWKRFILTDLHSPGEEVNTTSEH